MTPEHEKWLDQTVEKALNPEMPICDPHQHFWDWTNYRYFLDEFLEDISGGHKIRETVFVECRSMYRRDGPEEMKPLGETEFVHGIAAQSASSQYGETNVAAGIVSFAALTPGAPIRRVLEAHQAASSRFRGVRHMTASDPSDDIPKLRPFPQGLMSDTKFREGIGVLGDMGLTFYAYVHHTQLHELADLANAFPGVTVVLNHIGGPLGIGPYAGNRDQVFQYWKEGISALAASPNVVVKIGGLVMPLSGFDWRHQAIPVTSSELAVRVYQL